MNFAFDLQLVSLLQKAREVSVADPKREKEVEKSTPSLQNHLLSQCALFVCNKWDQVPEHEIEEVKSQVIERLKKYWPSLDPKSQIIYLSTIKATEAQNAGYISEDFFSLMDGLKYTVLKSTEARLELHWRLVLVYMCTCFEGILKSNWFLDCIPHSLHR